MKKILVAIFIILIFGGLVYSRLDKTVNTPDAKKVIITNQAGNDIIVNVELAQTRKSQIQGLSDRQTLDKGQGMLFVFPEKEVRSFWMKNMHFPLDIIWLDDEKIIKISSNLASEGEKPANLYSSDGPANYVLEVPANFCLENNIVVGNKIFYNY